MKNNNQLFNKSLKKLQINNLENSKSNKLSQPAPRDIEKKSKHEIPKKDLELNLILNLFKEKKYTQTIEELNIFLKSYPNDLNAKNILALSYKNIGNLNNAIKLFKSLIIEFPKQGFLYANLANLLYNQGKVMLAIEEFKRCIKIDPSVTAAYTGLSNCYNELGQTENAILILEKVLITEPKHDAANYNLGNTYRNQGRYKNAIPHYVNTDIRLSKSHLLECYYLTGDKIKFLETLENLEEKNILNPLAASLSSHSSIIYSQKNYYSFCDKPFDYIFNKNLLESNSLESDFIDEVKSSLKGLNLDFKSQDLLEKGTQSSGNIFMNEDQTIQKLKKIILNEIDSYKSSFQNSSDGYIKSWPENFKLFGWVVNISKGGSLKSHIHKEGWMSGSLYFEIPKKTLPNEGNIAFSLTGARYPTNGIEFEERVVETLKGEIVLFPSSVFHRTIPFSSNEERMTIAFDIMPTQ